MNSEADNPEQEDPDEPESEESQEPQDPKSEEDKGRAVTQEIRHAQVSARVPEDIGRGVFSTGAIVLQGPQEFILDFIVRLAHPHQVVSRIVMAPIIMQRFIVALQENLKKYQQNFGPPPPLPTPTNPQQAPSIEDIYDQLKLPEEVQSGVYCNAVMISHSPSEFCFNFITNFYPRSAVSARIYMASAQVPRLLDSMGRSFKQFQQKVQQQPPESPENPEQPGPGG